MKKWFKIFLVIFAFAAISCALYLIMHLFGITNLSTIKNIILKSGKWGPIVYTILLIVVLVAFCFVPLLNSTLSILGIIVFGPQIAFITNLISIFFSTSILFFIGDKLGEKFARKLIGEKSLNEAQDLIDHKSKFWLPIFFIIPGVPDEAICIVAGMTKIKYWYLLIVSLLYHALELGLFCFIGSDLVNWGALSIIDWVILINVLIIDIYLLIKLEKFLDHKNKK